MDGTQGMHGVGTFLFILFTLWLSFPFTSSLVDTPDDTVQNYLFWGSFVIMALVSLILVPFLIVTSTNSETNLIGALTGIGVWAGMLILNLVLFPIFNTITGIFTSIANGDSSTVLIKTLQEGTFIIQLISIIYLIVTVVTLYIIPTLFALKPQTSVETLKRFFQ